MPAFIQEKDFADGVDKPLTFKETKDRRRTFMGALRIKKKRFLNRKELSSFEVESLYELKETKSPLIARKGFIKNVSPSGCLLEFHRDEIQDPRARGSLNWSFLLGTRVSFMISLMYLEIRGKVTRTRFVGGKTFEIGITLVDEETENWRQCFFDSLSDLSVIKEKS